MTADPLARRATPPRILAAAEAGGWSPAAVERALEIATATPHPLAWRRFLARSLLLVGAGLLVAGVVCFVAYNWAELGRFGKLALVASGIVGAALVALWRLPRLSGQVSLTVAAGLVGALLAIYGQAYQTGADPYTLFLTWVLLITPWVIAARFTVLWVGAVVLVDITLTLWWLQVVAPPRPDAWVGAPLIVGVVHAAAVTAWEWQYRRDTPWVTEIWAPHELSLAGFGALVIASGAFILRPIVRSTVSTIGLFALAVSCLAIGAVFWYHRRVRRDVFMVTVAGAAGLALAAIVVGRVLLTDLDLRSVGLLLLAMFVIAEIAWGLNALRGRRGDEGE